MEKRFGMPSVLPEMRSYSGRYSNYNGVNQYGPKVQALRAVYKMGIRDRLEYII